MTTVSQRVHISFFGCTNAGKSSLVNAVTNQELSVVSDIKGTTTDPVSKTMEMLPLGAVVIIDTPGFDDESALGKKRVEKTNKILAKTDIAILVVDINIGLSKKDEELIDLFNEHKTPYLVVYNKSDCKKSLEGEICVSAKTGENIELLKEKIASFSKKEEKFIIKDKIKKADTVILVIPIDEAAPKGRIILPQQNVLRELLDNHNSIICCQVNELKNNLKYNPSLVITDSQAFNEVSEILPDNILLTSFSILFARFKGELDVLIEGAKKLKELKEGDKILISEGCTHHRQCSDIGTVKLPNWIKNYTKKDFEFHFTQGGEFPSDLEKYSLIVHCGGCMLNEKEMKYRIEKAVKSGVKIVNYGILIAYMNGILNRALKIFPEIKL
ncbi:[bacterium]|nr:[FeFe] hydrogenase H-cluster maturation GTPase HydF [bacterium]